MTTIRYQPAAVGNEPGGEAATLLRVAPEAAAGVSEATGPRRRRVAVLPSNRRAAVAARSVVRSVCSRWGAEGVAELAAGCVSELAANAAVHVEWDRVPFGERVLWLLVELWGPLLVVEVRDPSRVLPIVGRRNDLSWSEVAPGEVRLLPESGMGLRLVVDQVEQVKGLFGAVELPAGGKSVFFAVPYGTRS